MRSSKAIIFESILIWSRILVEPKGLTEKERKTLNTLLEDLRFIFAKEEILPDEIEDVIRELKSDEVKSYLKNLASGSKPEAALRETFFAGKSILGKYLAAEISPEVNLGPGFVDYQIFIKPGERFILLELKSLFDAEVEESKGRRVLRKLRQKPLRWEGHKDQVIKYIQKGGEYIILTNLKEWCFFNKSCSPDRFQPFYSTDLSAFLKDFDIIGDLREYLERRDFESIREELDKKFFESLEAWVGKLSEVDFDVDDRKKIELIISMINKFIFIQTLDDYGVIDFRWIKSAWDHAEKRWYAKGRLKVLQEFFKEVTEWFYEYYDTELFRENELKYVKQNEKNVDFLYQNLQLVLGLTYWQTPLGGFRGIMQYNFKFIDEDIFGKAYETFLVEVRKERGVFYTPKYITQYIVENTVGRTFDEILEEIKEKIKSENFGAVKQLVRRFVSISVLDPACGSGSFLIKAIKKIKDRYLELDMLLRESEKKYNRFFSGTLDRPKEVEERAGEVIEIREMLGTQNKRELISKILVRHIHGNDLDKGALEVAKVNIWEEAIKLAPEEFRVERLPKDTNHILPNLEMNLANGDSIVGLPEDLTTTILNKRYKGKIVELFKIRKEYLDDPSKTELIDQIQKEKIKLGEELDKEFVQYLKENYLDLEILKDTKPFHWALEFWFNFFDEKGDPLPGGQRGFDVVVGNPPYFTIRGKGTGVLKKTFYYEYLQNSPIWREVFRSHSDIYYYFTIKSAKMLNHTGKFGFIIENYWLEDDYADRMKSTLLSEVRLDTLIHFGNIKIFEDAGNDTCVLIYRKAPDAKKIEGRIKVVSCKKAMDGKTRYEQNEKLLQYIIKNISKYHLVDECLDIFWVEQKTLGTGKWILSTEKKILEKLRKDGKNIAPLADLGNNIEEACPGEFIRNMDGSERVGAGVIAQGMSPGLKGVFALSDVELENLKIEADVVRPLVTNSDIFKYFLPKTKKKIIYPYYVRDLEQYPFLRKYLEAHKKEMMKGSDRQKLLKSKKIRWFDYSVYRNREIFENEENKIVCPYRAEENSFALDESGYFGTTDMYTILVKEESKLSIKYLLGILNSKLLNFWYAESGKSKGGMFEYFTTPLSRMPIYKASPKQQEPIVKNIDWIILLKKAYYQFFEHWNEWSTKLKNSEYSLHEILTSDASEMRHGNFDKTWTSKVSFYPNAENEVLGKKFEKLKVLGDASNVLRIFGLDEEGKEELIYEMGFNNRDMMLHVYMSLFKTIKARLKINTLSQLLTKTMVPVVQPNVTENTPNIMRKVRQEFEEWLKEEGIEGMKPDPVEINNESVDVDAKIDALVFRLYELDASEIKTILDSLKTSPMYVQKVLDYFTGTT